ncbi:MAG TPA: HAMP domain-containing sensor histidine kinase [Haploplasma sp.]|nr:HAMP domain-containing sensor histidine kinase [Haploplasma sp.]
MKKKRKFGLSTQVNIIFTIITLITSLLFVIIFQHTVQNYAKNQANAHLDEYHKNVTYSYNNNVKLPITNYYTVLVYRYDEGRRVIIQNNQTFLVDEGFFIGVIQDFEDGYLTNKFDKKYYDIGDGQVYSLEPYTFFISYSDPTNNKSDIIITIFDGVYAKNFQEPIGNFIRIGFVSIIVLGNAIILLWSSIVVQRIKKLKNEVESLSGYNYQPTIVADGSDEITDLTIAIDKMREEIVQNEAVKTEMLQNISHDIKTPIAVISSYAEAIKDGITDVSDLDIIIKQSEILNRKVRQLLEWNKLEYIKDKSDFIEVSLKDIITNVANNHKYRGEIDIILDLDDSTYLAIVDNIYSMVNNIVENALRYAVNEIVIVLKDKKLTIFNDGEPISDQFLTGTFKPYEKGHKGQFGLGMTIVQRTVKAFGLELTIENLPNGVIFIIEPGQ